MGKKWFSACLCTLMPLIIWAQNTGSEIEIPFTKFVLDNGLTLIVHEDHKAPIVAVNIWYHVGSKNEKPGKTGFAHLFEHLMFNGSENFNDDYFKVMERIGATDLNGTTNPDRTNYFQNVPLSGLDTALWLESDRMGHLLGAITQEKLDEQRGVVQNEKRQGENQPYGVTRQLITQNTYPVGHPYSWTTIGSMEDLDAASLEDVHEWFKTYYGAANAVIVIAGDIDAQTAKQKVEHYFGDIPSGPPIAKHDVWIAKRDATLRQTVWDRVPQARLYQVWNIPQFADPRADHLDLVSDVLARGKTSRLYKRLVYEEQVATDVVAYVSLREIGGQFYIRTTAKPGGDLKLIEKLIAEELQRLVEEGVGERELQRVQTQYLATFVRGAERIGGFGGKSDILARSEVYGGRPDLYKTNLDHVRNATPDDLRRAAEEWLDEGAYVLRVLPFPEYSAAESGAARDEVPPTGAPPPLKFPTIQRAKLENGLEIILAERNAIPVIELQLMVDAGYAADQGGKPGAARLALSMLDEGTRSRSALEISEQLDLLGASLQTRSTLDYSYVSLSSLKNQLDPALDIFAEVILEPAFPEGDFERLQKQTLATIQREKVTPFSMALRVFPALLYGEGHAYGNPLTGSGTEASVSQITTADLKAFHQAWFKPNNATLLIVGDTTLEEIKPKLERRFQKWNSGETPAKNIGTAPQRSQSAVYLIDRPGALQSIICAGHLAPARGIDSEVIVQTMNNILGGDFTSRVNMNLREDKHWAYGASTLVYPTKGQRPFIALAPVQTDKTSESMVEVARELKDILNERPITMQELEKNLENQTLGLPGSWETNRSILNSLTELVAYELPEDYFQAYRQRLSKVSLESVNQAAKDLLRPENLTWVVVGDLSKVEQSIRDLGFGDILLIDSDGNPVEGKGKSEN